MGQGTLVRERAGDHNRTLDCGEYTIFKIQFTPRARLFSVKYLFQVHHVFEEASN